MAILSELLSGVLSRLRRRPRSPTDAVLSELLGLQIGDPDLYRLALRHRSVHHDPTERALYTNERLEFLGDALLGFIVGDFLYHRFEDQDEGFLTRLRAKLVNGRSLAQHASQLGLGDYVELSPNAERSEVRQSVGILADAYEAVVAAVYLDLGAESVRDFVHRTLLSDLDLEDLATRRDNFKSLLLEHAQGLGWPQPGYELLRTEGPDHRKTFTVAVSVRGERLGAGTGRSKKTAEQRAAKQALDYLAADEADDPDTPDVDPD